MSLLKLISCKYLDISGIVVIRIGDGMFRLFYAKIYFLHSVNIMLINCPLIIAYIYSKRIFFLFFLHMYRHGILPDKIVSTPSLGQTSVRSATQDSDSDYDVD